jgi:hypothetical protein
MDWSTIDIEKLKNLPKWDCPPSYNLQRQPGNCCAFDPPGYPTYFTRSVYTRTGNSPRKGPETVITYEGQCYVVAHNDDWRYCKNWDEVHAKRMKRLHSLWKPLPLTHPRTGMWIASVYKHQGEGYRTPSITEYNRPGTLFIQNGKISDFQHGLFEHERFAKLRARMDSKSKEKAIITRYLMLHVKPTNLNAYHIVREYYPQHQPWPARYGGDMDIPTWWETEAEPPTPETCNPRSMGPHPINVTWCQHCGWKE